MAYLALIRHGESDWNLKGNWTGWTDIGLNEEGREKARQAAMELKDINFDKAYTSDLRRAQQTLHEITKFLHIKIPTNVAPEIKEKNYGIYTGKNKWEVEKEVGHDEFMKIRRSWDYKIPEGESLKMVYDRAVPYYRKTILPELKNGENILLVAHGNSLRALVKYLDNIPDEEISSLEIAPAEVYLYEIDQRGSVKNKKILAHRENKV